RHLRELPSVPTRRSSALWLAHDVKRDEATAISTWSPCVAAASHNGYGHQAAPAISGLTCTIGPEAVDGVDTMVVTVAGTVGGVRSEEHTSELQSRENLVC